MIYQLLRNVLLFFFLWHRRSFPRGPPPGKNLEGWLGFTEGFTGFTKFWRVLLGFAGFYGFYWILLAFSGFYWVLRCFTVFYWVLLDFTGFYWLFLGFTGFYWVLLGFTGSENRGRDWRTRWTEPEEERGRRDLVPKWEQKGAGRPNPKRQMVRKIKRPEPRGNALAVAPCTASRQQSPLLT